MGVTAYIGLGSNLGNPVATLNRALRDLRRLPASRSLSWSRFYRNPPLGPPDQDDYVNAVAALDTRLSPQALLSWLQRIEKRHGRVRGRRWGPRSLDLDLLLYGQQRLRTASLEIPHPRLHLRPFVVYPLLQLNPGLCIPGRGGLSRLLGRCSARGLRVLQ